MITQAVDMHAHYYPPEYVALTRQLGSSQSVVAADARLTYEHPLRARDPMFTGHLAERVAMMDAAGIGTQVLSFAAPNLWHPEAAERSRLVRTFNDGCLEACRAYPGRFKLFANVPLPFVAESLAETERLIGDPDVVGVSVATHVAAFPIDDPRFHPLYAALDERETAVFVHPDRFCAAGVLDDHGMEWSLGAPFDDTIAVLRLVRSGIAARYPQISWIVPHLGGVLPFLRARIDQLGNHAGPGGSALPPLDLSGFLFDTCTPSPQAVKLAKEILGVERLVLGTDFPYGCRQDLSIGERVLREAELSEAELEAIRNENSRPITSLVA